MATEKERATEEKELIFGEPESTTYDGLLRKVAFTPGSEPGLLDRSLLHFRICERLGAGGMGTVYKALDEKLQRHVALKVLTRRQVSDEETTRALFREARLAARLGHPNIASIYEVHEEETPPFLVMEFVEGRTLRAELAEGPIPPARAVRIARDIAGALGAAHAMGIVHRDLKPANVMVAANGAIKLLDFGIATALKRPPDETPGGEAAAAVDTFGAGRVVGTPEYMSPEQSAGDPIDARSDVFTLGVVLYEMLTGVSPFRRQATADTLIAVREADAAPVEKLNPAVSADLGKVVGRCLAKRAEGRFADVGAVEQALAAAAPAKSSGRRGWPLLLGAAVVIGVGAVAVARVLPRQSAAGATSASSAAPRAITFADLPPPKTSNPEALEHFRAAMRDIHDFTTQAQTELFVAVRLDPTFAAAQLRLALIQGMPAARKPMREAVRYRESLDARDQAILDAESPVLFADPEDWKEATRRLEALHAARPDDVEILFWLSRVQRSKDPAAARASLSRVLELDPTFAIAESDLGVLDEDAARWDEAQEHYQRCVRIAPIAAGCWLRSARLSGTRGDCTAFAVTVQKAMAVDTEEFFIVKTQLAALMGTSASRVETDQVVDHLLRTPMHKSAAPEVQRHTNSTLHGISALWYGSFAEAKTFFDQVNVDPATGMVTGYDTFFAERLTVAEQTGDEAGARALAKTFAAARRSLPALPLDGFALRALRAHQVLPAAEIDAHRDRWLATHVDAADTPTSWILWVKYWADASATPENAAAAMAHRHEYDALPEFPGTRESAAVGHALLLAGRAAEAIPWLEQAAFACQPIVRETENSFVAAIVPAAYELGQARQASGDSKGACAAYQRVLDRWGNAVPRSTTADNARARMSAIRCNDAAARALSTRDALDSGR